MKDAPRKPGENPAGEIDHSVFLDPDDQDLVLDDETPLVESAQAIEPSGSIGNESNLVEDEEFIIEDDSDSVEVVVKLQSSPEPTPKRPQRAPVRAPVIVEDKPPAPKPTPQKAPPRFPKWWIATAAALLLLLGAGAWVFLQPPVESQPEMIGALTPPLEDPVAEAPPEPEEAPKPEPVAESVSPERTGLPAAPPPTAAPIVQEEPPAPEPVAAVPTETPAPPTLRSILDDHSDEQKNIETSSIAPDETIVELKNGNTFAGRLRRYDSRAIELEIWNGLITLTSEQLKGVLSPDEADYKPIESLQKGYVELPNRNRIYGRVFKVTPTRIILYVNGARFGFSPAQVRVGYLKPGEEPPPEPGFQGPAIEPPTVVPQATPRPEPSPNSDEPAPSNEPPPVIEHPDATDEPPPQ